ncbi:hypothetical protein [Sulfuricurvum sp.]|uniref:hypothetical protein n=1 Tax=Sulfuricurvum sp. TaxID=2025608 RepID=UPI003BB74A76
MKIKLLMILAGLILLIGFFYFYDFNREGHGLEIENHSDGNITILKIVNDDKELILPIGGGILEPKPHNKYSYVGACDVLSSGRYTPGTLKITIKNEIGEIKTASCILKRSSNVGSSYDSEFIVKYMGDDKLICQNIGFEGASCDFPDRRSGIKIIDVNTSS